MLKRCKVKAKPQAGEKAKEKRNPKLTTPGFTWDAMNSDHIKELNNARPKQPFFFLKPPSSILLPNAGPVLQPRGVIMHYEVELALVMGRELRDFDERDTKGAVEAIDSMFSSLRYCPSPGSSFWEERRGEAISWLRSEIASSFVGWSMAEAVILPRCELRGGVLLTSELQATSSRST